MKIDGTTYPADERSPVGSKTFFGRIPSIRESLALAMTRVGLHVLKVEPGDVVVVRGGESVSWQWRQGVNKALWRKKCVAVFLPWRCRVHYEPSRLKSEDRGYGSTANRPADTGVFVGTPEEPCVSN